MSVGSLVTRLGPANVAVGVGAAAMVGPPMGMLGVAIDHRYAHLTRLGSAHEPSPGRLSPHELGFAMFIAPIFGATAGGVTTLVVGMAGRRVPAPLHAAAVGAVTGGSAAGFTSNWLSESLRV